MGFYVEELQDVRSEGGVKGIYIEAKNLAAAKQIATKQHCKNVVLKIKNAQGATLAVKIKGRWYRGDEW